MRQGPSLARLSLIRIYGRGGSFVTHPIFRRKAQAIRGVTPENGHFLEECQSRDLTHVTCAGLFRGFTGFFWSPENVCCSRNAGKRPEMDGRPKFGSRASLGVAKTVSEAKFEVARLAPETRGFSPFPARDPVARPVGTTPYLGGT